MKTVNRMILGFADYGTGTNQVTYLDIPGEAIALPSMYNNLGVYTLISGKKVSNIIIVLGQSLAQ